jgi:hypothetical protein
MVRRIFDGANLHGSVCQYPRRTAAKEYRIALDAAGLSTGCRLVVLHSLSFWSASTKGSRKIARAVILGTALCLISRLLQSMQNPINGGRLRFLTDARTRSYLVPFTNYSMLNQYPSTGFLSASGDDAAASMPSSHVNSSASGTTLLRVGSTTELPAEMRQTIIHLPHRFPVDGKRFHRSREGGMPLFSWPGDGGEESRGQ